MRGDVVKATELMEKAGYPNGDDGHILSWVLLAGHKTS
jgi:hypothetical protein